MAETRKLSNFDKFILELPEKYQLSAKKTVATVLPAIADQIITTPCFGHLWKDESGTCPEEDCILRVYCCATHTEAQQEALPVGVTPPKPITPDTAAPTGIKRRGRYRGTEKYKRAGYVSTGRAVDEFVRRFVHALGYPKTLPHNWTHAGIAYVHKIHGRMLAAPTKSYYGIIVDSMVVCRFWLNADKKALVDLSALLCSMVQSRGYAGKLLTVTTNSFKKLTPCTGRVHCCSVEQAEQLAALIKEGYDIT